MGYPLILVEGPIGQGQSFPTHIETTVREGIGIDVFAGEATREIGFVQDDPFALVGESQLLADVALLSPEAGRPTAPLPQARRRGVVLSSKFVGAKSSSLTCSHPKTLRPP